MRRIWRAVRAWWRRKPLDVAIAEADRLLAQLRGDASIETEAQKQARPQAAPVVKFCRDCRWCSRDFMAACRCPQQKDYNDRLGGDNWVPASLLRKWDCHGHWWEAR